MGDRRSTGTRPSNDTEHVVISVDTRGLRRIRVGGEGRRGGLTPGRRRRSGRPGDQAPEVIVTEPPLVPAWKRAGDAYWAK